MLMLHSAASASGGGEEEEPGEWVGKTAHYVRQGASGTGSGNDWTNAYTTLPAALTRDHVYYIADGSYVGYTFNDVASGTLKIYVVKATASDHGTETGWDSTYGDGVATFTSTIELTTAYHVFDGQSGGGPDNWTTGHGFAIDHTGTVGAGVDFAASNQTVRHVKLTGNNGSDDVNSDSFSWSGTASNILVSHCYTTNAGRCVIFHNRTSSDVVFEYCYFGSIQGFGSVHGETASIWGEPTDWTIRYSIIADIDSTGGLIWDNHPTSSGYFRVYGCVFYDAGSAWGEHGNGVVGGWTGNNDEECHNLKVYNCTFVTVDSETPCLGSLPEISSGLEAKNNLFYSCSSVDGGIWTATHNHFISSEAVGTNQSSSAGDPFVDFAALNFRLTSNTTAGTDLGAPFNVDMYGNTRTTWTRGAIEYVA